MCRQIIHGHPKLGNKTKICHHNSPKINMPDRLTAEFLEATSVESDAQCISQVNIISAWAWVESYRAISILTLGTTISGDSLYQKETDTHSKVLLLFSSIFSISSGQIGWVNTIQHWKQENISNWYGRYLRGNANQQKQSRAKLLLDGINCITFSF